MGQRVSSSANSQPAEGAGSQQMEGWLLTMIPIHARADSVVAQSLRKLEHLFLHCPILPEVNPIRTFVGCYRHTGEWFVCRIRSYDCDGTLTIVWEDGTLQIGTKISEELQRMPNDLSQSVDEQIANEQENRIRTTRVKAQNTPFLRNYNRKRSNKEMLQLQKQVVEPPTHNGLTVWEASKRGDLETVLTLIDRGDATPNTVETLDDSRGAGGEEQLGRTPLYWACFGGHVELVRELLARGGVDADGTAYLAVTSRERANDNRDLMFDPDTNTFSDWVDYPTTNPTPTSSSSPSPTDRTGRNGGDCNTAEGTGHQVETNSSNKINNCIQKDDTALIRAMLAAASATPARRRRNMNSMRQRLPQRLYNSTTNEITADRSSECVVCLGQTVVVANPSNREHSNNKNNKTSSTQLPLEEEDEEKREEEYGKSTTRTVSLAIAVPCGHICTCQSCLELIRKRGVGCPICRSTISAIVPHRT